MLLNNRASRASTTFKAILLIRVTAGWIVHPFADGAAVHRYLRGVVFNQNRDVCEEWVLADVA
jgi:hypothetical protein